MKALAFTQTGALVNENLQSANHSLAAKMQVAGAATGLIGGIGSGVLGGLLIAAGWITSNKDVQHWLSTAGSVLLLLTIPLIILGACCLDWLEKDKSRPNSGAYRDDEDEEE